MKAVWDTKETLSKGNRKPPVYKRKWEGNAPEKGKRKGRGVSDSRKKEGEDKYQ